MQAEEVAEFRAAIRKSVVWLEKWGKRPLPAATAPKKAPKKRAKAAAATVPPLVAEHVTYTPAFLTKEEADDLQTELERVVLPLATPDRVRIPHKGTIVETSRNVAFLGPPGWTYKYTVDARPTSMVLDDPALTPALVRMRLWAEAIVGHPLNVAIFNDYPSGTAAIGWHSDAEAELEPGSCIASVSLGGVRDFALRASKVPAHHEGRGARPQLHKFSLEHGSLVVMGPTCQRHLQHSVPRVTRKGGVARRFNVTLRRFRPQVPVVKE